MELLLVGLNHRSVSVSQREGLAALGTDEWLRRLRSAGWQEAVVVSTCNRFEVYAGSADLRSRGPEVLEEFLESNLGAPLGDGVYRRVGGAAARRLFTVAAGLDSLVVGESEILGQVKQAYETARSHKMTGKLTNVLFQRALYAGKLVRSRTGIGSGRLSVASAAVALAERIFGNLSKSSVLILGAGKMAELSAKHLLSGKVSRLYLANRTWTRAVELAAKFRAEAIRWEDFPPLLSRVDIVISSTGAPKPIMTAEGIAAACRSRRGRSLFLIDIAMPRDIEESVHALDHVYLYTLQDLDGIVAENSARRRGEVAAARALVDEKSAEFQAWIAAVANGERAGLTHSMRGRASSATEPSRLPVTS
ncbi:MAG: glutamyl-tRNA reductase [Elusimicrobia bacterium]|nr:glutamyl-tRNA reductase [Elusimicrobiota bacterium]